MWLTGSGGPTDTDALLAPASRTARAEEALPTAPLLKPLTVFTRSKNVGEELASQAVLLVLVLFLVLVFPHVIAVIYVETRSSCCNAHTVPSRTQTGRGREPNGCPPRGLQSLVGGTRDGHTSQEVGRKSRAIRG